MRAAHRVLAYNAAMLVPFVKMHGCGNDFVVLDERVHPLALTPARARAIADRRFGVGCDQLISLRPAPPNSAAALEMRIQNPDGSEAGACGNATRCVVDLIHAETGATAATIRTIAGDLPAEWLPDGRVRVDMGPARLEWHDIPLAGPADTLSLDLTLGPLAAPAAASMGNPHATFFVPDADAIDLAAIGPALEHAPIFPERANIGVVSLTAPGRLRLRVWERGAGLTLSCGSGACAAVVNATRRGLVQGRAVVTTDGGDLDIEWTRPNVLMTGPVATAFRGTIDFDALPA